MFFLLMSRNWQISGGRGWWRLDRKIDWRYGDNQRSRPIVSPRLSGLYRQRSRSQHGKGRFGGRSPSLVKICIANCDQIVIDSGMFSRQLCIALSNGTITDIIFTVSGKRTYSLLWIILSNWNIFLLFLAHKIITTIRLTKTCKMCKIQKRQKCPFDGTLRKPKLKGFRLRPLTPWPGLCPWTSTPVIGSRSP